MGYVDEVWWSRLAQPVVYSWTDDEPLRLLERSRDPRDGDPKALACYGMLRADTGRIELRFVQGRPISAMTTQFLAWVSERLQAMGKTALFLVWDNASWHVSQTVRAWLRVHNRQAKQTGGVRIIRCQLPTKSPWLNRIEPHWVHGKQAIVEPTRPLTADELIERVYDYYECEPFSHLSN